MKKIIAIIGSASADSSSHKLIHHIANITKDVFNIQLFDKLKALPHFDPALSTENTPAEISDFRAMIEHADGIIFCTPEYIFSIPSGLKNILEWSVATTIFSGKITGIITASANGEKGHAELQMILHTLTAKFTEATTLLVRGVKGKFTGTTISDNAVREALTQFVHAFKTLLNEPGHSNETAI